MPGVECLPDGGEASLRAALAVCAPDLSGLPLRITAHERDPDPLWWSGSAVIDDRFVAKYAWSDIRAQRLWREGVLLQRLRALDSALPIPEPIVVSEAPALVVTRFAAGVPLSWEWAGALSTAETARVGSEIASFLAALHAVEPTALLAGLPIVEPVPQASTERLRAAFPGIVDDGRARRVVAWCAWVDEVLDGYARPGDVLVHGDLHGYNQLWDPLRLDLSLVVDFETSGLADPHFDLRYLPGNAPSLDLALTVMDAYARKAGRVLAIERVMAWHVLTVLGDALWRTEAGVALPGAGAATSWVDDLARRLDMLHLG